MRTIKNLLWALLPIFALTLAVGCEKGGDDTGNDDPINVTKDSILKLKSSYVDVSLAGGDYTMMYEIENAHAGEKITAESAESWVNNFNTSISGIIYFSVDANPGSEARQCLVTVKYRYAEDVTFVVKQGAKVDASFTLENVTPELFGYTVDVIPSNKTLPYIVQSVSADYIIEYGLESDQDYYEYDFEYFGWVGSFYGESAVDIMNQNARIGDQRGIYLGDATSGMPYTFYCYYFDVNTGALASDIAYFEITTLKPEKIAASFDAQYEVDGCVVTADVVPTGGYDGAYYFDMLNGLLVDYYIEQFDFVNTPAEAVEFYWAGAVQSMMKDNMSGDMIVSTYDCRGLYDDGTPRSHFEFELLAEHTYYLFAFAMDEHGLCCSEPKIVEVVTGSVPMSYNKITPTVSKITAQTAYIKFETINDDYYIAGWEKASDWATYGNTDAERQRYLLENRSYEFLSGNYEQNVIGLEPGTDYVLYAFGSRGGVATTSEIFTCPFSTKSGEAGSATIEFNNMGYFLASDIAEIPGCEFFAGDYYSGKAIFPVEFIINGEWQAFSYVIYNWNQRYDEYPDSEYVKGLVWNIDQYGSMDPSPTYTTLDMDVDYYTFAAMVIDEEGMYSNLAKLKVVTTYDGANSDISVFEAFWDRLTGNNGGAELQSLVVDDEPKELFRAKAKYDNKLSKQNFELKPSRMEL